MANTVISIDTSFDVIEKQRELVTEALGADGVYIRFKETLKEYFDEGALKNPDIAAVVGQTISQMATSITNSAMNTALDWAAREKALVLQKEELEYKIDLMKLEAEKLAFEKDAAEVNKHYLQAKLLREMGTPTIVDGDVTILSDDGKYFHENNLLVKELSIKSKQELNIEAQTDQVYAQVHKLVADTYVNHGMFTGYTISDNGITGTSKQVQPDITLSEMNKKVAAEQAKGYSYNAWSNAASSSSGMIGTLIAAEVPNLDPTTYLNTWKAAVDKLNSVVSPVITQTATSV